MKKNKKNKNILVLMIVSQLLLSAFVIYWLMSQYIAERNRLSGELEGLYISTSDELVDTLLFKSYVTPALIGKGKDHLIIVNDTVISDTVLRKGTDRIVSGFRGHNGSISVQMNVNNRKDSDTVKNGRINDEMLLRSVRMIVKHTKDPVNGDPVLRTFKITPDTAAFKEHYLDRLYGKGMKFQLIWGDKKEMDNRRNLTVDIMNSFNLPAVSFHGYKGYLFSNIMPQIGFGLVLIVIVAFAFVFSYRTIREHEMLALMRNEFISNMSHELKTPVSTISVALESLGRYRMMNKPEVAEEYLGLAISETKRLEQLVNRILDHSMLEENLHQGNLSVCNAGQLLSEAVSVMKTRMGNAGSIEIQQPENELKIICDPLFLKGVFINLIDNSIKYCDKIPHIRLFIREEKGFAVIEFQDNGPGIPEEYHMKIFEKFFRVPSGNTHNVKGYGLGLSFAYMVMKLHRGSISIGKCKEGCTFILRIPVAV
ncbi:MAG TPA: HAMP domain-containing sensor histidine kinase [Bacteroidales bacterium]|nr:HAMP domain-containing sensor histidine kinase [Bacteroidales bacterium]